MTFDVPIPPSTETPERDPLMSLLDECPVDALVTVAHAEKLAAWLLDNRHRLIAALGYPPVPNP